MKQTKQVKSKKQPRAAKSSKRPSRPMTQARLLRLVQKYGAVVVHVKRLDQTRKRWIQEGALIQYRYGVDVPFDGILSCFEGHHIPNVQQSIARMYEYDRIRGMKLQKVIANGRTIWKRK